MDLKAQKPLTDLVLEGALDGERGDWLWRLIREQAAGRGITPMATGTQAQKLLYLAMRMDGTADKLAEMLALQQVPRVKTDSTFLEGHCNGNQFEHTPLLGDYYQQVAAEHGVSVTGKVYKSGLARFPGDPEAWVSGTGDVKALLEKRGWSCEGSVTVKPSDIGTAPIADIDVADDIVESRLLDKFDQNPDLEAACRVNPERLQEAKHEAKQELLPAA